MGIYNQDRLSFLENRHSGERCVLIANGPSLNHMDLSFLKDETCIGLNKIYLGFEQFDFYPKYYVAVNDKVIYQAKNDIEKLNCIKFLSQKGSQGIIRESAITYILETTNPAERFCKDIRFGIHEGWTVTYAALQIAYFLGFQQIIIIGMDHRFDYTGEPNESQEMIGNDPNHFCLHYFEQGQTWDNPDLEKAEDSYKIARKIYESDGRSIMDATLNGACTIFEKKHYKELF